MRLAARHWDHLVPVSLGDVTGPATLERRDVTPDLWNEPDLDAAETSFSRYVRARARGDDRVVGLPIFVMRGFRHRCIIVRRGSALAGVDDLRGARVGLTGWPDSGNVWTRAIVAEGGVGFDEVDWRVGRLTADHPHLDRLSDAPGPQDGYRVSALSSETTLVGELLAERLEAVMTPFMPPGFYGSGSPLRPLFSDPQAVEQHYFETHGFVPGMHLVALRRETLEHDRSLAQRLVDQLERAKLLSFARRAKLADITPWQNEENARTTRVFGADWLPYGLEDDRAMVAAFQDQLIAQQLLDHPLAEEELFPLPVTPEPATAGVGA